MSSSDESKVLNNHLAIVGMVASVLMDPERYSYFLSSLQSISASIREAQKLMDDINVTVYVDVYVESSQLHLNLEDVKAAIGLITDGCPNLIVRYLEQPAEQFKIYKKLFQDVTKGHCDNMLKVFLMGDDDDLWGSKRISSLIEEIVCVVKPKFEALNNSIQSCKDRKHEDIEDVDKKSLSFSMWQIPSGSVRPEGSEIAKFEGKEIGYTPPEDACLSNTEYFEGAYSELFLADFFRITDQRLQSPCADLLLCAYALCDPTRIPLAWCTKRWANNDWLYFYRKHKGQSISSNPEIKALGTVLTWFIHTDHVDKKMILPFSNDPNRLIRGLVTQYEGYQAAIDDAFNDLRLFFPDVENLEIA